MLATWTHMRLTPLCDIARKAIHKHTRFGFSVACAGREALIVGNGKLPAITTSVAATDRVPASLQCLLLDTAV
eukprot:6575838-Prymnesium_polylepis.2